MNGVDSIVYNRASMEEAKVALDRLAEIILDQLDSMMQKAVAWRNHPDTDGAMAAAAEAAIAAIKETQNDITAFMTVVGVNIAASGAFMSKVDQYLGSRVLA